MTNISSNGMLYLPMAQSNNSDLPASLAKLEPASAIPANISPDMLQMVVLAPGLRPAPANRPAPAPVPSPAAPGFDPGQAIQGMWNGFLSWFNSHIPQAQPIPQVQPAVPSAPAASAPSSQATCAPAAAPERPTSIAPLPDPASVDVSNQGTVATFLWKSAKQLLNRCPHGYEMAGWTQDLKDGKSLAEVQNGMKSMLDARMNAAAQAAVGRPLTDQERAIYNGRLQSYQTNFDQVIAEISKLKPSDDDPTAADASQPIDVATNNSTLDLNAKQSLGRSLTPMETAILDRELAQGMSLADADQLIASIPGFVDQANKDAVTSDPGAGSAPWRSVA